MEEAKEQEVVLNQAFAIVASIQVVVESKATQLVVGAFFVEFDTKSIIEESNCTIQHSFAEQLDQQLSFKTREDRQHLDSIGLNSVDILAIFVAYQAPFCSHPNYFDQLQEFHYYYLSSYRAPVHFEDLIWIQMIF